MTKQTFEVIAGLGEEIQIHHGLTFKQAVKTWVREQSRVPTCVEIVMESETPRWEMTFEESLAFEAASSAAIAELTRKNADWVIQALAKQSVYNSDQLLFDNPFTMG